MSELKLFMVYPTGYENKMALLVAYDYQQALKKSLLRDDIKVLSDSGVELKAIDLDKALSTTGHKLTVERIGLYH